MTRVRDRHPRVSPTIYRSLTLSSLGSPRRASYQTREHPTPTSVPPECAKHAPGKCSRKVPPERANLTPPPCRLMSQVGRRVAQHARLQNRASKSALGSREPSKLCRQSCPTQLGIHYWCSAPVDQAFPGSFSLQAIMPNAALSILSRLPRTKVLSGRQLAQRSTLSAGNMPTQHSCGIFIGAWLPRTKHFRDPNSCSHAA